MKTLDETDLDVLDLCADRKRTAARIHVLLGGRVSYQAITLRIRTLEVLGYISRKRLGRAADCLTTTLGLVVLESRRPTAAALVLVKIS